MNLEDNPMRELLVRIIVLALWATIAIVLTYAWQHFWTPARNENLLAWLENGGPNRLRRRVLIVAAIVLIAAGIGLALLPGN
jgi:hypothetical protein